MRIRDTLRSTWSTYRHEVFAYFVSPIPYFFMFVFAAIVALIYFLLYDPFRVGVADAGPGLLELMPFTMLIVVPGLTMRLWSDEAASGTQEILLTLPVSTAALAVGKFLAALTLLAIALVCTLSAPITLASLGDLDWKATIAGYLGAFSLGAAMIALGLWVSALTRHQMVAFIGALFANGLLLVVGVLTREDLGLLGELGQAISLYSHYDSMGRGVLDLRDVLYFGSVVVFFLYVNVRTIENRRYS